MNINDKILTSTKYVVDNSHFVKINKNKIDELSKNMPIVNDEHWIKYAPFDISKLNEEKIANYLLVMHSVGFSFWGNLKWTINCNDENYDGSFGLMAALDKAMKNGYPILDYNYLCDISEQDFDKILEGNVRIPLFYERLEFLRGTAKVIKDKFDGNFLNVINDVNSDENLLNIIVNNFTCFKDKSPYKGENVFFYKKAQLIVSDIFRLISKDIHKINDISKLTACADYKIPQVLRALKILEYSDELSTKVDNKIQVEKDSEMEVEIRANTIWAIEKIKNNVMNRFKDITSIQINDGLWVQSQKNSNIKPYHLTRTTAY